MRPSRMMLLLGLIASSGYAQLTMDQKMSDFQALSALYAKRYAPYEWKRDLLGYDLFQIAPWIAKVQATKNDLDFYEIMVSYVASLNDAHANYSLPASFQANLNFGVDLYEGKLLVDFINRTRLPVAEFQFLIGYELVSIDGQDAQTLVDGLLKYDIGANARSTRRLAAGLVTVRPEVIMPHAADVPEISTVVFRRPDAGLETYRIPWTKAGLALTSVGQYITPKSVVGPALGGDLNEPGTDNPAPPEERPSWMKVLDRLQNCRIPDKAVLNFGSVPPVFAASLPSGFTQRLGRIAADAFYSGTFAADGYKIGYIRIPSFAPANQDNALTSFQSEIAYFQANTDGLVIDVMRNPGGSVAYGNAIVSLLMPTTWRSIPFAIRSTSEWVTSISSSYESAKAQGAPQSIIDMLNAIKTAIVTANHQMRGLTDPVPIDDVTIDRSPAVDTKGNVIAYTKPILVLVDEMSASAGDAFAATIQDNSRGPLFGWRTMGAGGNSESWEAGTYSLGFAGVTESLMVRQNAILTAEYPATNYIENVGVRPDIQVDYMTRDNLLQNGRPFVDAFVAAMVKQIKGN